MLFLVGVAVVIALVIGAAVPLLLPWKQHLRWMIASTSVPEWWGPGSTPWYVLEEVTIEIVTCGADSLVVLIAASCSSSPRLLWLPEAIAEQVAVVEQWAATGTALLHVSGQGEQITLLGPSASIAGLRGTPTGCALSRR